MIKAYYRGAAVNSLVTDSSTVKGCPVCETSQFVVGVIAVEDWTAKRVVCENGHSNNVGDLIDLKIEDIVEELEPPEPEPDEFENFIEFGPQFTETSDRHATIAAGAWFDNILTGAIRAFLANDQMANEMLGVRGSYTPLGSFAARIDFCYAFGLISEQDRKALLCLKSIRNDFAHTMEELSLTKQSLADQTANFARHLGLNVENYDPRTLFNDSIHMLFSSLAIKQHLVRRCSRMPFDPTGQLANKRWAGP